MGKILKVGCLIVLLGGIGLILLIINAAKEVQEKEAADAAAADAAPISTLSWREIDGIYNLKYKRTEFQQKSEWPRYAGKKVKWSGTVENVAEAFGTLDMLVKMNPDTFTNDLLVQLKDSERQKAVTLQKGDSVTFIGVLKDWGTIMPITLDRGEIVAGNK